jgi:hypothetical protein
MKMMMLPLPRIAALALLHLMLAPASIASQEETRGPSPEERVAE